MTALYAVAFLSSLGFSIVMPFMVFLVTRVGGNALVLGALSASFWAAQLIGSTWLGALSDRIGRKRVLFRSQLGAMAAWLIFLCAPGAPRVELARVEAAVVGTFAVTLPLALIALARITGGLFNGSVSVANAYLADLADEDERKLGYARLGAAGQHHRDGDRRHALRDDRCRDVLRVCGGGQRGDVHIRHAGAWRAGMTLAADVITCGRACPGYVVCITGRAESYHLEAT